jgi:octanoyl-[GcvH]:protein N-octanoyltransferase
MIASPDLHLPALSASYHSDPLTELKQDDENLSSLRAGYTVPSLRFWMTASSAIVSKRESELPHFEKAARALQTKGWPIYVRSTGGTICPLGPGVLNLSYVNRFKFADRFSSAASYTWFCNKLLQSISHFGVSGTVGAVPGCYCDGGYNIVVSGRKLIGTSQRCAPISRDYQDVAVLMHATILVSADKERLCNIVNSFNALTEQEVVVSENALINLAEICSSGGEENIKERLIDALAEAFHPTGNTREYPVSNC